MLVFMIPLKSARSAASWQRVSELFAGTIASVCAQTSGDYRAVVACHELPEGYFSHPKVEFIQIGHPPPPLSDRKARRVDKKRKLYAAFQRARHYSPNHVMFLDSDDLVSKRVAEYVAGRPAENGWYLRSGYIHCGNQERVHFERRRFHQWCGSSHIVRPELLEFRLRPGEALHYMHRFLVRDLKERNIRLSVLPFPGAMYRVSHGDNFHDHERLLWPENPCLGAVRRLLFQRAITPGIREEFGLD